MNMVKSRSMGLKNKGILWPDSHHVKCSCSVTSFFPGFMPQHEDPENLFIVCFRHLLLFALLSYPISFVSPTSLFYFTITHFPLYLYLLLSQPLPTSYSITNWCAMWPLKRAELTGYALWSQDILSRHPFWRCRDVFYRCTPDVIGLTAGRGYSVHLFT